MCLTTCLQSHLQSFTQPPQTAHSSASTFQVWFNSPPTTTPFKSLLQSYLMMASCTMLPESQGKTDHHPLFRNLVFKQSSCQLICFLFQFLQVSPLPAPASNIFLLPLSTVLSTICPLLSPLFHCCKGQCTKLEAS